MRLLQEIINRGKEGVGRGDVESEEEEEEGEKKARLLLYRYYVRGRLRRSLMLLGVLSSEKSGTEQFRHKLFIMYKITLSFS